MLRCSQLTNYYSPLYSTSRCYRNVRLSALNNCYSTVLHGCIEPARLRLRCVMFDEFTEFAFVSRPNLPRKPMPSMPGPSDRDECPHLTTMPAVTWSAASDYSLARSLAKGMAAAGTEAQTPCCQLLLRPPTHCSSPPLEHQSTTTATDNKTELRQNLHDAAVRVMMQTRSKEDPTDVVRSATAGGSSGAACCSNYTMQAVLMSI